MIVHVSILTLIPQALILYILPWLLVLHNRSIYIWQKWDFIHQWLVNGKRALASTIHTAGNFQGYMKLLQISVWEPPAKCSLPTYPWKDSPSKVSHIIPTFHKELLILWLSYNTRPVSSRQCQLYCGHLPRAWHWDWSMAALDGNKDTTTHHRLKDDGTIGHLLETEVRAHVWIALCQENIRRMERLGK